MNAANRDFGLSTFELSIQFNHTTQEEPYDQF